MPTRPSTMAVPANPTMAANRPTPTTARTAVNSKGPERMPLAVLNPTVVKVSSVMATAEVRP